MAILEGINPATGERLDTVEEIEIQAIPLLIEKGRQAFQSWGRLTIKERLHYLKNLKDLMVRDMEKLAQVIADDTGKPLVESLVADIMPTLDAMTHIIRHAEKTLQAKKVKTPLLLIGKKSYVEYMPRGLVLVISPWNYPLQLALVPVVSALASGNTVIIKPSEVTPLVGKSIEELFINAGFPNGVVQVAHGGKEVGAHLTEAKPDYIFFTGSVRTGKIIQKVAAEHLIPTTLELGGKDPFIVFADANLKRAAKGAIWAAFTNSGQVCMSAERVFIERKIYHQFTELLKEETEKLIQGSNHTADIGSMTYKVQVDLVKQQVKDALDRGATLTYGIHPDNWSQTMFIKPTILTDIPKDAEIVQEETFGPILPLIPFDKEEDVIALANGTEYGLNASVWTSDQTKARRVASQLVSGAVVINDAIVSVANHHLPFGGAKDSGIGRYHGEEGLKIFCHEKAIVVDSGKRNKEIQWYPYEGKYEDFLQLFKSYFGKRKDWLSFIKRYLRLLKK